MAEPYKHQPKRNGTYSPFLTRRFDLALQVASGLHFEEERKGTGTPYMGHLMSVCALVLEAGGDEDQAIASLLHSAVEKHGGPSTLNTIRQLFGIRVADALEFRSDSTASDLSKKIDWRGRREKYLEHLRNANGDALLVAAADKLHDARAMLADARKMGEKSWLRFKGTKEDQLWVYAAIIDTLRGRATAKTLVDELSRVVAELRVLQETPERVGTRNREIKPYSPFLTRRFNLALQVASELHFEQPRKETEIPYIAHLMAVCALVLESGGDEDQAISALLHDAVEDQGGLPTLDAIRRLFGDRVAVAVEACSDSTVSNPERKLPWRDRKQKYLEHLRHADEDALIVAVADKLHNARAILSDYRQIGEELWSRFSAPKEDQLEFYDAVVKTLRSTTAPSELVNELDRVVSELSSSARRSPKHLGAHL
jgi:(p)ppGpp synthase/HD superfamily hydrolase